MKRSLLDSTHRYASTALVSEALGVSVTTVKRWVDDGILPAHRTAGGHRKLLVADVIRLARDGQLPHADLGKLDGRTATVAEAPDDMVNRLVRLLFAGDAGAVREFIHAAYHRGTTIEWLADRVVSPAMARIGHQWEAGQIDVLHEHRSTQLIVGAIFELKAVLDRHALRSRPVALGGAIERDHYLLPTLLAQTALLDAGWQAINLGPNTPFDSFRKAIVEFRPKLVWVSVSYLDDVKQFETEYVKFYREAHESGIAVALGGRALDEAVRMKLPYTTFGDGLTHLAAFAGTLHPRRKPPKRGRPLKR